MIKTILKMPKLKGSTILKVLPIFIVGEIKEEKIKELKFDCFMSYCGCKDIKYEKIKHPETIDNRTGDEIAIEILSKLKEG